MKEKGKEVAPTQYFSFSNNNNNKVITFFSLGFCDSKDPMFTMTSSAVLSQFLIALLKTFFND